jgi:AcrR family transcriptional regulator
MSITAQLPSMVPDRRLVTSMVPALDPKRAVDGTVEAWLRKWCGSSDSEGARCSCWVWDVGGGPSDAPSAFPVPFRRSPAVRSTRLIPARLACFVFIVVLGLRAMLKTSATSDWREARRHSAREAIVDAAWDLVHEEGLAALTLRGLASRAGVTTPTLYAYFDSKHAIFDAMFGRAATVFADRMVEPFNETDPSALLVLNARRFVDFCASDVARYYLLFQRTIPDFEPSADSYAPAIRALDAARQCLALNGITQPMYLDLWTALISGLVDQQLSNDPGGDRWTRLIEETVTMFLAHCRPVPATRRPNTKSRTKGVQR